MHLLQGLYEVYYAQYKTSVSTRSDASGSKLVVFDGSKYVADFGDCGEENDPFWEYENMSIDSKDVEETQNALDFLLDEKYRAS